MAAAATSIASQLQAIKSFIQTDASADLSSSKRPLTRPSIIFNPKEAAQLDLQTILSISLEGLEALIDNEVDVRFRVYRDTLFSHKSADTDRELMTVEENNKINDSIASYLRLLSGHFHHSYALKTLEYLIRRYKIHVYNVDELILCALPYHETHAFVRIVQLLDLGNNSKWGFLNGVKATGAPPPRNVIVQQCIRDTGVLEVLLKYATPMKKYYPSKPFVTFFTAVVVEMLGSLPNIDSDTVRRILPFVFSGLESATKVDRDHKAGALMLVGLLANKAALAPKLVKALIESIARVAQQDAKELADLPWLRMLLMAIIGLVQSQSIQMFPKKALKILKEVGGFGGVLSELSQEFNINKFLSVYLESLASCSSEEFFRLALMSAIETLPAKDFIYTIVAKVLTPCLTLPKTMDNSKLSESGLGAKQILVKIGEKYPSKLQDALSKLREDLKLKSKKEDSMFENMCMILDGLLGVSQTTSDSAIWFSLEHPKVEIRRSTLIKLGVVGGLKSMAVDSQKLVTIREAIIRRLHDEDLGVVQAALSLNDLSAIIDTPDLIEAFRGVLLRCIDIDMTSASFVSSESCDIAKSCLDCAILNFKDEPDNLNGLAALIFPLLIIFPKTWRLNVKVLELAKQIQCPLYRNIFVSYGMISGKEDKKLDPSFLTSVNMKTVGALAEAFLTHPEEHMPWLIESCNASALSKTLLFLVVLQSLTVHKEGLERFSALFHVCFPILKREWVECESMDDVFQEEEFNTEKLDRDCIKFLGQLSKTNFKALNADLLICIFWRLIKPFISASPQNATANYGDWLRTLEDLFVFFATSRLKNVFKEHLNLLVMKCSPTPFGFLSKFFTEEGYPLPVQVESLLTFETICCQSASLDKSVSNSDLQLLLCFPSILVPLSSEKQDIRLAAMKCIEGLYRLWHHIDISSGKNGNGTLLPHSTWLPYLGGFLGLIIQQKRVVLSDWNFLQSFLTAALGSSCNEILVPQNTDQRFDQHTKEAIFLFILNSALKLSAFGKLVVLSLLRGMGDAILKVEGLKSLMSQLLERRSSYHLQHDKSYESLSSIEIETLCLLLETCAASNASVAREIPFDHFVTALQVNSLSSEDPAVVRPCVTVLQKLNSSFYSCLKTEMQDQLFQELVFLFRIDNSTIQNAAKEALLQINVTSSTVAKLIDLIIVQENDFVCTSGKKKKKPVKQQSIDLHHKLFSNNESRISFLGSLVDVLLLKKDIDSRASLAGSLFDILRTIFADEPPLGLVDLDEKLPGASSDISQNTTSAICYIQQTVLLLLEDISVSLVSDIPHKDDILDKFDVKLLVECARGTEDATIRNHIFSLLTSVSKVVPEKVLDHVVDIFTVIGESAITQSDGHSQSVLEDLMSTIIPFWLSSAKNAEKILQIFIDVLPDVSENRRLTIIVYLLRTLGETSSFATLLHLLIRSLVSRTSKSWSDEIFRIPEFFAAFVEKEWEYEFAMQVCSQYSCLMWLPSLVILLEQVQNGKHSQDHMSELLIAMRFVKHKLQDTELVFKIESGEDSDNIQMTLGALMEQTVCHLQLVDARSKLLTVPIGIKKELKDSMEKVLKTITKGMLPTSFFKGITLLLGHADRNVRNKALRFLCETVSNLDMIKLKGKKKRIVNQNSTWIHFEESSWESLRDMCSKIIHLVDGSTDDLDTPVKLAAFSALEVLANKFPADDSIFVSCLTSITNQIDSQNLALSSSCLRTVGALINVVGPKALSELPQIMKQLLRKAHDESGLSTKLKPNIGSSGFKDNILLSTLVTLEAVVDKLGSFLNPYLGDIIELMVLRPEYVSGSDLKMKARADTVRRLITEKIPVRLTLAPLLRSYSKTVKSGESSVSIAFEMLANIISTMDKSSIGSYHMKIFEQCLLGLDLRREHPVSIKVVDVVEQSVVHAVVLLTTKLTETMFKPIFIRSLEWADSKLEGSGSSDNKDLDRPISFYILVNKLVEQHRSLFVPYFKYLLEGCTHYLMGEEDSQPVGLVQKKKKAKIEVANNSKREKKIVLSPRQWHLRWLIISSFHKCFVYDTGSLKFLDQSNFQALLKPIVLQLIMEPPTCLEELPDVPSVKVVDDSLVVCLGQMAVAAGSDLLWKPLNHEVLMQTRSEKSRARMLGLRVVKYMVEHLKEEYLVLLPETIPFLGELLEDTELEVKSLAQEILKDMEAMSGESLREYL